MVAHLTVPTTLVAADGSNTIADKGVAEGSGEIIHTLPVGVEGMEIRLMCTRSTTGDAVRVRTAGDDVFRLNHALGTAYTTVGPGANSLLGLLFVDGEWNTLFYRGGYSYY